jgi:ADP-ribosyl-[dinitrogen reductase] hydrolase
MSKERVDVNEDAIVGTMLGLACGDALGAPAEFLSRETLRQRYGRLTDMVGNQMWEPGEWTDDTAMALCVAEGILARPDDPIEEVGRRFLEWRASGPKDVGSTISDALGQYRIVSRKGQQEAGSSVGLWPAASQSTSAAKRGMAAGNGSLMRTLPVALAYPDMETMLCQSARISAMTHWDPQAEACCDLYCLWLRRLLTGEERLGAWQAALEEAKQVASGGNLAPGETPGTSPLPPHFWPRLEAVPTLSESKLQPTGYAGYVLDCLEAAAWWVLHAETLEETLIGCVNLAGEADTIAAVAGGAAGAVWVESAIPPRWRDKLKDGEKIERAARELARLRQG